MKARYDIKEDVSLSLLTRVQEGLAVSYHERGEEDYWTAIAPALEAALERIETMRSLEGLQLKNDIISKTENIKKTLGQIEVHTPRIIENYRLKTRERISDLLADMNAEIDEIRLANEIAIYADKTNINEEIVRIYSHLDQIHNILNATEPVGRKLDFLVQELNREVNTIGSKSPDLDVSNLVIELKSDIEQIREQIQNIE